MIKNLNQLSDKFEEIDNGFEEQNKVLQKGLEDGDLDLPQKLIITQISGIQRELAKQNCISILKIEE